MHTHGFIVIELIIYLYYLYLKLLGTIMYKVRISYTCSMAVPIYPARALTSPLQNGPPDAVSNLAQEDWAHNYHAATLNCPCIQKIK